MNSKNSLFKIDSWSAIKLSGADVSFFLSGQFTSDIESLSINQAQFSARVSRTGLLKAYCYLIRLEENVFLLFSPSLFLNRLRKDLEKFIIMEDVVAEEFKQPMSFSFNEEVMHQGGINFFFLGKPCSLFFDAATESMSIDELDELSFRYGLPSGDTLLEEKTLINETGLVDLGVSLNKGCFVGQETIKKIENNRGAGKKEILLKASCHEKTQEKSVFLEGTEYAIQEQMLIEGELYLKIKSKREHRINGKVFNLKLGEAEVICFSSSNEKSYSGELFERGIQLFTEDKDEQAKALFELALKFVPDDEEVLESLGALEGRLGNYKRAIELMDDLEKLNPRSVMASTNKSLFYMKIGEIEKAEEEKAKATVKGFEAAAKDSKEKAQEDLKEVERRISMFEQVLEIDPEDQMANEGLSKSYFNLGKYEESLKFCEKLIDLNKKDFRAKATKVKIKMKNGESEYALKSLPEIIELAGKSGDFVLANEMQSLLSSLTNS